MSNPPKSMFHEGHRELQDRFDGRKLADALEKHRRLPEFGEEEISFIKASEFFFLATSHDQSVDCSFKGGAPGFVRVTGPTSLEWSELDGNSMYRSLGNLLKSPRIGMLFIRFSDSPKRLRVNGTCTVLDAPQQGAKISIRMDADEIFPNCPRYIPDLSKNAGSPFLPNEDGTSLKPGWKDFEDLRDALPADDPHRESD